MSAPRPPRPPRRPVRRPGWVRAAGWLLLLLGSLVFVTWRQTHGLALETGLRDLESRRAIAEAERVELVREIEALRSRARIVRVARDRYGLHLPTGDEIVFVPVGAAAASTDTAPETP